GLPVLLPPPPLRMVADDEQLPQPPAGTAAVRPRRPAARRGRRGAVERPGRRAEAERPPAAGAEVAALPDGRRRAFAAELVAAAEAGRPLAGPLRGAGAGAAAERMKWTLPAPSASEGCPPRSRSGLVGETT